MIRIDALEKHFGKLHVLKGITAAFQSGKATAIVGHNGSGKTTLIKCILGMVIPDTGDVTVFEEPVAGKWKYRERIGYMPQIGRYPDNMKIGQVFHMMKDLRPHVSAMDEQLISEYRLEEMSGKAMRTLSGGTRQKVSAALAFMFNPEILILDEPTAGLDPVAAEILRKKILREKKSGKLIIISSHIMSEVEELADDILLLDDGLVRFHKSVQELKDETGESRISGALAKLLAS